MDATQIAQVAVPATVVLVLTYVFQMIKPVLERLPGLRPADGSHDDGLRLVYALLSFVAVLGYTLATSGAPVGAAAWMQLLVAVAATAVTMTVGGHYLYQRVSGSDNGTGGVPPVAAPAAAGAPDPADGVPNEVKLVA